VIQVLLPLDVDYKTKTFYLCSVATNKEKINDVNPVKNNETQQRKGTQDRSMDRFEGMTSTRCL
jgi:hypothetical protein